MGCSYRDLIAWQKAVRFVSAIYRATATFPRDELYGLVSQLRRASLRGKVGLRKENFANSLDTLAGPSSRLRPNFTLPTTWDTSQMSNSRT